MGNAIRNGGPSRSDAHAPWTGREAPALREPEEGGGVGRAQPCGSRRDGPSIRMVVH